MAKRNRPSRAKPWSKVKPPPKPKNPHIELAQQRADAERRKVSVKCLGLDPVHSFLSADPRSERICPACRHRIDQHLKGVSPTAYRPLASPGES